MKHRSHRRRVAGVVAAITLVAAAPAAAQTDADPGPDQEEPVAGLDTELLDALESVGLVEEWTSVGTRDPRSTLVTVSSSEIEVSRRHLLDGARELAEVRPADVGMLRDLELDWPGSRALLARLGVALAAHEPDEAHVVLGKCLSPPWSVS